MEDSPLGKLPAELRVLIWEEAVRHSHNILVSKRPPDLVELFIGQTRNRTALPISITQTCRTVRKESLPLFYSENTFVFDTGDIASQIELPQLMKHIIGIQSFANIQHIRFELGVFCCDSFEFGNIAARELCRVLRSIRERTGFVTRNDRCNLKTLEAIADLRSVCRSAHPADFQLYLDLCDLEASWERNLCKAKEEKAKCASLFGNRNWRGVIEVMEAVMNDTLELLEELNDFGC